MPETKVPALPDPNTIKDPHLRRVLAAVKEALDIRLGRRGDKMDRAVTVRELYENGVVKLQGRPIIDYNGKPMQPSVGEPQPVIPPAPRNLKVFNVFQTMLLEWDAPRYLGHSMTEIWRSTQDDLSTATLVGTFNANVGSDFVDYSSSPTYFYWIRFVSNTGHQGAYNATAGTKAVAEPPVSYLLEQLEGSITSTALSATLRTQIDSTTTTVQQNTQVIAGISAQYTVRIDNNGRVAGYGLASGAGGVSDFMVLADRFSIFHPSASQSLVFGVEGGRTIISGAYIQNASIDSAKIQSIAASKISTASLSAISANLGTVTAGRLRSPDGLTDINLTQGTFRIRSGASGARLDIQHDRISVYDQNGVLRVRLGRL